MKKEWVKPIVVRLGFVDDVTLMAEELQANATFTGGGPWGARGASKDWGFNDGVYGDNTGLGS